MKPKQATYCLIATLLLCLWGMGSIAQTKEEQVAQVKELTAKTLQALQENDPELAIIHGIDAVNQSVWANHELTAQAMLALAKAYYAKGDYNNALDFSVQALTVLNQTNDDLDKTEAHSLLGDIYLAWKIPIKAIDHLEEAYQLKQVNQDSSPLYTIERLARAYLMNDNHQRASVLFKQLLEESEKQEMPLMVLEALKELSLLKVNNKQYEEALEYATRYEQILNIQNATIQEQALAKQNLGYIHRQLKNYEKSVDWMLKAVDLQRSPSILNNLGVSYIHHKEYEKAAEVFEESLTAFQQDQDIAGQSTTYTYLAANEHVQGLHQEALELVSEAVLIARQNDLPQPLADAYVMQSEVYAAMGDFRRSQEAYKLQSEIRQQLEAKRQKLKENAQQRAIIAQEQETQSQMMVSDKEKQLLQLQQAKLEAEKQAKELVVLTQEKQLQRSKLANEALEKQRAEQALAITKAQLRVLRKEQEANSLAREKEDLAREREKQELIIKQKELEELEKQMQLSILTKENVALEQKGKAQESEIAEKEEILEEKSLKQQQSYIIIGLVSLLLLLAIAAFIWSLKQQRRISDQKLELEAQKEVLETQQGIILEKNEELQASEEEIRQNSEELLAINEQMQSALGQLQHQKTLVDKKNANITSSINYARRIQQSILPKDSTIHAALPESFVFYLPKDIVSGDFYWFYSNDTHFYIAAVDCTGHGVPGAFMSLIGHSLLRDTVAEKGMTNPSKILDAVHLGIMQGLRQYEDGSGNQDGMDASLCVVDKANRKLHFAGAHNPLVYIQAGELHEVKGDRYSIGGRKRLYDEHFTEHEIDLSDAATSCYLFSDGFQDQFGGPKGRKFMRKQLKSKLLEIHELPMKEQGQLMEQEFYQWMGREKQLDDVLLMGFKWSAGK